MPRRRATAQCSSRPTAPESAATCARAVERSLATLLQSRSSAKIGWFFRSHRSLQSFNFADSATIVERSAHRRSSLAALLSASTCAIDSAVTFWARAVFSWASCCKAAAVRLRCAASSVCRCSCSCERVSWTCIVESWLLRFVLLARRYERCPDDSFLSRSFTCVVTDARVASNALRSFSCTAAVISSAFTSPMMRPRELRIAWTRALPAACSAANFSLARACIDLTVAVLARALKRRALSTSS
mmetsp:Transcript_60331/g.155448  ORF Transcript_60331/g.155448 Transcript_60331/m.155448 type:complete len:244 (-) Transcript_60331:758-1489(-)